MYGKNMISIIMQCIHDEEMRENLICHDNVMNVDIQDEQTEQKKNFHKIFQINIIIMHIHKVINLCSTPNVSIYFIFSEKLNSSYFKSSALLKKWHNYNEIGWMKFSMEQKEKHILMISMHEFMMIKFFYNLLNCIYWIKGDDYHIINQKSCFSEIN